MILISLSKIVKIICEYLHDDQWILRNVRHGMHTNWCLHYIHITETLLAFLLTREKMINCVYCKYTNFCGN